MVASLVLVHTDSYEPAVSFILFYFVSSVGIITAAIVVPLLPAEQFSAGTCGSVYALYAAVLAMMVFFSVGVVDPVTFQLRVGIIGAVVGVFHRSSSGGRRGCMYV